MAHAEPSEKAYLPALAIESTAKSPRGHFPLLFFLSGTSKPVVEEAEQRKNGCLPRFGRSVCCTSFSVGVGRWLGSVLI